MFHRVTIQFLLSFFRVCRLFPERRVALHRRRVAESRRTAESRRERRRRTDALTHQRPRHRRHHPARDDAHPTDGDRDSSRARPAPGVDILVSIAQQRGLFVRAARARVPNAHDRERSLALDRTPSDARRVSTRAASDVDVDRGRVDRMTVEGGAGCCAMVFRFIVY